jgi:hypothetical protein
MAFIVEQATNLEAGSFVTPSSRYSSSNLLYYGEDKIITFETYKRTTYTPQSEDKFTVVPPGEEFRPDLTSYRAYGTVDFWWRLMQVNKIYDIFDYKAGLSIRVPQPFADFS